MMVLVAEWRIRKNQGDYGRSEENDATRSLPAQKAFKRSFQLSKCFRKFFKIHGYLNVSREIAAEIECLILFRDFCVADGVYEL